LEIVGRNQPIYIIDGGGFDVDLEAGKAFKIQSTTICVTDNEFDTDDSRDVFELQGSGIEIDFSNNRFNAVKTNNAHTDQADYRDNAYSAPSEWIISVKSCNECSIKIIDNIAHNFARYKFGFFQSQQLPKSSVVQIIENKIEGFHGVYYVNGTEKSVIRNNELRRNSFGNIVASNSSKLKITNNKVIFPGNGTSGDGLTVSGGVDIEILDNEVIAGSCYGIWLISTSKSPLSEIIVKNNIITDGITSGIYISSLDSSIEEIF